MARSTLYMDTAKVAQLEETINKEKHIQRRFFEAEAAAGRLAAWQPPPPARAPPAVGMPSFTAAYATDATLRLSTSMSKALWAAANPGYVLRDGAHAAASTTHHEHAWDEQAVAFMKEQGEFDKQHHMRRDEFAQYVEAAARAHHRLGKRNDASTTSSKGKQ